MKYNIEMLKNIDSNKRKLLPNQMIHNKFDRNRHQSMVNTNRDSVLKIEGLGQQGGMNSHTKRINSGDR